MSFLLSGPVGKLAFSFAAPRSMSFPHAMTTGQLAAATAQFAFMTSQLVFPLFVHKILFLAGCDCFIWEKTHELP